MFDFDFTYFWILTENYRFCAPYTSFEYEMTSYFLDSSLVGELYPSYTNTSKDSPAYFGSWGGKSTNYLLTRVKYSNKTLSWFTIYNRFDGIVDSSYEQFNKSGTIYNYIVF